MKLSPVLHFVAAAIMKAFLALTFLTALSLAAGVDVKNLKPRHIFMPVNPKHTYQEWQDIFAAQKASPEVDRYYRKGTEPQPEFAGKVHVPLDAQHHRAASCITAARGQFPWQAAILVNINGFCGGSLIHSSWVLTAAHCSGSSYQVTLGAYRYEGSDPSSLTVMSTLSIIHPNYNPNNLINDVMLIQLLPPIILPPYISPIRIQHVAGDLPGRLLQLSGWGTICGTSKTSPTLNYVDLTAITSEECAYFYGINIPSTKICCAPTGSQTMCFGDSGGPLSLLESDGVYTQVGIVSFGFPVSCQQGYPPVFDRVSNYLNWISSHTGI